MILFISDCILVAVLRKDQREASIEVHRLLRMQMQEFGSERIENQTRVVAVVTSDKDQNLDTF